MNYFEIKNCLIFLNSTNAMILIFKWNRRTQKITIRSKNRPPRKKVPFLYYKLNFKIPSKGNLGKSVRIDQGL